MADEVRNNMNTNTTTQQLTKWSDLIENVVQNLCDQEDFDEGDPTDIMLNELLTAAMEMREAARRNQ